MMEIFALSKRLSTTCFRCDRPSRLEMYTLLIFFNKLKSEIRLEPFLFLKDIFLSKLSPVKIFIKIIILFNVLFFDLKHILQHLVVIIINPFQNFDPLCFAILIALCFCVFMTWKNGLFMLSLKDRLLWQDKLQHCL